MSDEEDPLEGWQAPRRLPLIAALAMLAVLTIALILGGKIYLARIAPATRPPHVTMPAPQLETFQTPPGEPRAWHPKSPAGIDRAIADVAAKGDAVWNEARP